MPGGRRISAALAAALAVVVAAEIALDRQAPEPRASAYVVLEPFIALQAPTRAKRTKVPRPARRTQSPPTATRPATVAASLEPDDPLWQVSWSLAKVGAPLAWRLTTGSPDVIVAVVDTGIDVDHPDLRGAVVPGWDVVNGDANATDDHGHGTAVAGVIAARSNNGLGVTGACWRCSLMPVKVIGADGIGTAADIAEGVRWAADHGAAIVNMSFVMSGPDAGVASAIDYARAKGVLVVAAAGNTAGDAPTFPASYPGVISVTATDPDDRRYEWATHGGWVSVAAPGCSQSTMLGGAYGEFCGTSSSAAFMSGVAALVSSVDAKTRGEVVFSALATDAVRVGGFVSSGRLDVAAALQHSWGFPPPAAPPAPRAARD